MVGLKDWKCPFCQAEPAGDDRVVHCSNVGCPLNRVDFTVVQWCTREVETELVFQVDTLRDKLSSLNAKLVELAAEVRERRENEARRLAEWRLRKGLPPHRVGRAAERRVLR